MATSCPTPAGSKQRWCDSKSFVYTRVAWWTAYTRSNQDFFYYRSLPRLFVYTKSLPRLFVYTRSLPRLFVYTRSLPRLFVYTRWCSSIHTGRLGGRYTPVERLRRRFCDGLREARLLGDDARWGRLVLPISTTVGGWAWRPKAAASGRAASIATLVSGRWARGNRRHTILGLSLIASPASRVGQVIWGLAGRPEKGLVQGCSREGEERPDP